MTEEVKEKLLQVYREALGPIAEVYDVFVDYYGEDRVDLDCVTFDDFIAWLYTQTLGTLGITMFHTDHYHIDAADYEANGRGKKFPDYIPDLNIIDYVKPSLKAYVINSFHTYDHIKGVAILVRWPKVRVTNEFDKYVDITELYAQVCVDPQGRIIRRFYLTRTEYNLLQWVGGYTHSHVPSFSPDQGAPGFRRPCTGAGPINGTIETLRRNKNLEIWGLFVYELDKYVGVESIAGTPHYRLENINKGDIITDDTIGEPLDVIGNYTAYRGSSVTYAQLQEFIKYFLLKKNLKFCYRNGSYGLGETFIEFWLKVSNCFIEWYNQMYSEDKVNCTLSTLMEIHLIAKYVVAENRVSSQNRAERVNSASHYENQSMFRFKGEVLKLHITDLQGVRDTNISYLIDTKVCRFILTMVLKIVNGLYGREQSSEASGEASTSEKCYIL